jgi:hypothetical protein
MNLAAIPMQRLRQQGLLKQKFATPADVVGGLGVVQAQDFSGALWAIAQRMEGAETQKLRLIESAFNRGDILRTHVLRPTWHFVTPADIRWLLMLTAPRVHALNASYARQVGLDQSVLHGSREVIEKALQGGKHLTREALAEALEAAGIVTKGPLRYPYILMYAELEGVICSGAKQGNHHTYALLEERVAPMPTLTREEALAELTKRYFSSRGPVTIKDFVRWCGLTITDARAGVKLVKDDLDHEDIEGQGYWWGKDSPPVSEPRHPIVHWLPNYDEYLYGYTDGFSAIEGQSLEAAFDRAYTHGIVVNGKIVGSWRRTLRKSTVTLETRFVATLTTLEEEAVITTAHRFGEFLGRAVVMA